MWEDFKDAMAEDFVYSGMPSEVAVERVLQEIQEVLASAQGKTTEEYNLPLPQMHVPDKGRSAGVSR